MNASSVGNKLPSFIVAIDRVWIATVGIAFLTWLRDSQQLGVSIHFVMSALWHVLPFLLLSICAAAYAKATGADSLISKAFQGRTLTMIATASLIGALSPFCSCGVIPLITALLSMGVPLAPVMSFWLASPLMDPVMFTMTSGVIGVDFAIAKTLAAVGIGLLGGFGIWTLQRFGFLGRPLRPALGNGGCGGSIVRVESPVVWSFWREHVRTLSFVESAVSNLRFLGGWLVLAFLLESLMLAYIPANVISSFAGGTGLLTIISAALLGVPAYLNGYAALPLVSGLIDQGMQQGAGLAFLLAGGVTSIPAAIAVFALARIPVFVCYLLFAFIGSVAAGMLYAAF